ncbi:tudor domain-containing protein 1-like [Cimex lectularius]|uniref:RING finger protein 17 n=1 Tax=Cimex lectularius TaxID=79782 RepID=A0A8I6RA74_CIMLE|nr:tudor domain-containing protein 1-like [Cimex lectularius]
MESSKKLKLPACANCSLEFSVNGYQLAKPLRIPLLLHCAHSVCENCVTRELTKKASITCLTCKTVSIVPTGLTQAQMKEYFPVNHYLCGVWFNKANPQPFKGDEQISFNQPQKQEQMKKQAVNCNECSLTAIIQCTQCSVPYCDSCYKSVHSAAKALKDHIGVPISSISCLSALENQLNVCNEHAQNFEFHCGQCNVAACSRCLLAHHNGHSDMQELAEKNKKCREELISSYVKVADVHTRLKLAKKQLSKQLANATSKSSVSAAEKAIKDHFTCLHGHLILLQNKLMRQLVSYRDTSQLNDMIIQINNNIEEVGALLSLVSNVLQGPSSSIDFSQFIHILNEKENTPCFLYNPEKSEENSSLFTFDKNIFKLIDDHCNVSSIFKQTYQMLPEQNLPSGYIKQPIVEAKAEDIEKLSGLGFPKELSSRSSSSTSLSSLYSVSSNDMPMLTPTDDLVPGVSLSVYVSHLVSPGEFYVQRVTAQKKLEELQQTLQRLASNRRLQSVTNVTIGTICLVLYKDKSSWHRVRVVELASVTEAKILYIDFGITETVPFSRLKALPTNLINIPGLAIRCKLANCVPRNGVTWDLEAVALMIKIIDNEKVYITVINKTQICYEVSMHRINENSSFDVAQSLCFLDYAAMTESTQVLTPNIPTVETKKYFALDRYPFGSILEVSLSNINNVNDFYVVIKSDILHKYLTMLEELQKTYNIRNINNKYIVYNPKEGMPVAAKSSIDKKWYRASIVDVPCSKMIKVFYIDYGNVEVLSWKNVKILASKFFKLRPQAHKCNLSEVEPIGTDWSPGAKLILESYMNSKLKAVIQNIQNKTMDIILYHTNAEADICINAQIVREGHARSTGPYSKLVEFPKVYKIPAPDILQTLQCDMKCEPELQEDAKKMPNPLEDNNFFIKSPDGCIKIQIDIKRIVDPGEFYVSLGYLTKYFQSLEEELQHAYSTEYKLSVETKWKENEKCAVFFENKWWRGYITELLEGNRVMIIFPETGAMELIEMSNLRPLKEKFMNVRDGALKCHLGGLIPASSTRWSGISITEFEEFVNANQGFLYITKMADIKNKSLPVELYAKLNIPAGPLEPQRDQWRSFNHYIRMQGYAKADEFTKWNSDGKIIRTEAQITANKIMEAEVLAQIETMKLSSKLLQNESQFSHLPSWLPPEKFEQLEFVGLPTYVSEDGIYIQDFMRNTSKLQDITEKLFEEYNNSTLKGSDHKWQVGQMCCALFYLDKKWYRGEIMKVENKTILVKFIDFGNEEYVDVNQLRKPMYKDVPTLATLCKFHKLKPIRGNWDEVQIEKIHSLVVEKFCRIKVIELNDGCYGVDKIILPNGKNALDEIVSMRCARYIDTVEEEEEFLTASSSIESPRPVSIHSKDSATFALNENNKILSVNSNNPVNNEENTAESEYEIIHWTTIANNSVENMLNLADYQSFQVPENVKSFKIEPTAVLSPTQISVIVDSDIKEVKQLQDEYNDLLIQMETEGPKLSKLKPPYLYKACCTLFSGDRHWYRAIVVKELSNCRLLVQYVDYGNVEEINADEAYELKKDWFKVKVLSIPLALHNLTVNPDVSCNPNELMEKLYECLTSAESRVVIKDRTSSILSVDIYDSDSKRLIYQKLIDDNYYKVIIDG